MGSSRRTPPAAKTSSCQPRCGWTTRAEPAGAAGRSERASAPDGPLARPPSLVRSSFAKPSARNPSIPDGPAAGRPAGGFSVGPGRAGEPLPEGALAAAAGVHGRAGRTLENLCKIRVVGEGADDAEVLGRVHVGPCGGAGRLVARHAAPGLRKGQEVDALLDVRQPAPALLLQRPVRHLEPPAVRDVLAQRQVPAHRHAARHLVLGELVGDARGAGPVAGVRGGGPPLLQPPLPVVLPPLVVEAVGHLVAEHGADGAIVARVGVLRAEEGRLQDPRRDEEGVLGGVVVGVDHRDGRGPRVPPRLAVHGRTRAGGGQDVEVDGVDEELVLQQLQGRTHWPPAGVAHLKVHLVQLLHGLVARLGVHPRQLLQVRRKRLADLLEHVGRRVLGGVGKVGLDEELGDVDAEGALRHVVALALAGRLLLGAVEDLVEGHHRVHEVRRHVRDVVVEGAPAEVGPQLLEGEGPEHVGLQLGEVVGVVDGEGLARLVALRVPRLAHAVVAQPVKEGGPGDGGAQRLHVGQVQRRRVLRPLRRPVLHGVGEGLLHQHHVGRVRRRLLRRPPREQHELLHRAAQRLALLEELRGVGEVVVPVRQAQAHVRHDHDLLEGVVVVLLRPVGHELRLPPQPDLDQVVGEGRAVDDGVDVGEELGEGRGAQPLDGVDVHARLVQRPRLPLVLLEQLDGHVLHVDRRLVE
mmetsp:Transcript_28869/g.60636  ORF Transcript_28869/g.60636 Transcript_28869/m.60636 type:complete len:694 (-) Transcript_28869:662-2743(-)